MHFYNNALYSIATKQTKTFLHALNSASYKTRQNISRMPCNHRRVEIDIMQNTKTSTRTSLKCMYVMNSTSENLNEKKRILYKNIRLNCTIKTLYFEIKTLISFMSIHENVQKKDFNARSI